MLLTAMILAANLGSVVAAAQDDPNETPLGDVARDLRKKNATPARQQVIDDDNLPQLMEQAEKKSLVGSSLKFLMSGDSKAFRISAPDVTCSLSFSANTKSLLSNQYAQMELPWGELPKLAGQATVEGDALTIPVSNGTSWHLSEVAVAFTVIRKRRPQDLFNDPGASEFSTEAAEVSPFEQVRPEKKPDVTVIYRMRAAAPPWAKTVFSAPIDIVLNAGDEWHWAIVDAKGYPPDDYADNANRSASAPTSKPVLQPASASALDVPQAQGANLPVHPR